MLQLPAEASLRACRNLLVEAFTEADIDTPELDARLLLRHALGLTDMGFFTNAERRLDGAEIERLQVLAARRLDREPVSRIIGRRGFWKHEFELGPETLDPRPDSETLIEAALDLLEQQDRLNDDLLVVDLGTGSGALLLSLLGELPKARGVGIDISANALAVARRNAERLQLDTRAGFRTGDWLDGLDERADVILCNPPYIAASDIELLQPEVARFDPRAALDGGDDGLDPYRRIFPHLSEHLRADGLALFEFGEGQHAELAALAQQHGLSPVGGETGLFMDLSGHWRVFGVRSPG